MFLLELVFGTITDPYSKITINVKKPWNLRRGKTSVNRSITLSLHNHSTAKDYRPISLRSFLLKVLERILDFHIREKKNPSSISLSQHAYIKGKSTKTALYEAVGVIEISLEHKQFTLAAFLDIEGAFNNVKLEAIAPGYGGTKCWIHSDKVDK